MKNDFIMKREIGNIRLSTFRVMAVLPALLLTGCVAREVEDIEVPEEASVPIEFGITGTTVTAQQEPTRSGEVSSMPIDFLGWEHTGSWDNTVAWTWKAALADAVSGETTTADGTKKTFALNPRKYYDTDNDNKTTLVGFYPPIEIAGTHSASPALRESSEENAIQNGFLVYPCDGTVDVITTNSVTGSKNAPVENIGLLHRTSQIALEIKAKSGYYDLVKDFEILKVTLKNPDGSISVPGRIGVDGAIKSSVEIDDFTVFTETTSKMYVPQTAQSIGIPAFLTPESALPEIEVTLSRRGAVTCPITGITSLEAGKKYVITIDVSSSSLNVASATITDWEDGNTLEGDATL